MIWRSASSWALGLGRIPVLVTVCWVAVFTATASAGMLTLNLSSLTDLSAVTVGDTFRVDVSLRGLEAGEALVTLTGGTAFSSALGTPLGASAGSIVPNPPADPLDFQTIVRPGQADANFLTFSTNASEQITDNGVFYHFDVEALAPGSGSLSLRPLALAAEQFNSQDPSSPILRDVAAGQDLQFTAIVPEPSVWQLMLVLVILRLSSRAVIHKQYSQHIVRDA